MSTFLKKNPLGDLNEVENHQLMSSAEDNNSLREGMIHIISLTLMQHLQAFGIFKETYPDYLHHPYSDVMNKKSVVVCDIY